MVNEKWPYMPRLPPYCAKTSVTFRPFSVTEVHSPLLFVELRSNEKFILPEEQFVTYAPAALAGAIAPNTISEAMRMAEMLSRVRFIALSSVDRRRFAESSMSIPSASRQGKTAGEVPELATQRPLLHADAPLSVLHSLRVESFKCFANRRPGFR